MANACPIGLKCFKCSGLGHKSTECPGPGKKNCSFAGSTNRKSSSMKEVEIGGSKVTALVNTGSELTLMRSHLIQILDAEVDNGLPIVIRVAGGQTFEAKKTLFANIKIDGFEFQSKIVIVEENQIPYDLIIGEDVLAQAKIVIDSSGVQVVGKDEVVEVMSIEATPAVDLNHIKND